MTRRIEYKNYIFTERNITSMQIHRENALAAESLGCDTFTFRIHAVDGLGFGYYIHPDSSYYVLADNSPYLVKLHEDLGALASYTYGDPVRLYVDNELRGVFYIESVVREGMSAYKFQCVSAVGLLMKIRHYGGMYQMTPAADIIADILGDVYQQTVSGVRVYDGPFPFRIEEDVASCPLSGLLRVNWAQHNLLEVMLATGAGIYKDDEGELYIKYLQLGSPVSIADGYVAMGGKVNRLSPPTRINITEHSYYAPLSSDPVKVLFDSSAGMVGADRKQIIFDEPMYSLDFGTLEEIESGVNYAIVSGTGVLTGKAYTHASRILSVSTGISSSEKEISVSDCGLISVMNSGNLAKRLQGYYSLAEEVSCDIVTHGEVPGDHVSLRSPYGDIIQGVIRSQDEVISAISKARTAIAKSFVPGPYGNNYKNRIFRQTNDSITVPPGVTKMFFVLGGGGQGGAGGFNAESFTGNGSQAPGPGAEGGEPGQPGKLFSVELDVTPGTVISVSIGDGGQGGVAETAGSLGSATSMTIGGVTYSSEDGVVPETGFVDLIEGDVYSIPGDHGFAGGRGGESGSDNYGESFASGANVWPGGQGTDYWEGDDGGSPRYTVKQEAAGGGGAAYGAAGNPSVNGWPSGNAGAGADAADAAASTVPGGGGNGGHGGGGHGYPMQEYYGYSQEWHWNDSYGGAGSKGGKGGKGYILALY